MDDLIETLRKIGIPEEQCRSARKRFANDLDGLTIYVLFCIAMFDDRHEYI